MAHSFNIDSHHLFASPAAFTTLKSQSVVDTVVDTLSTLGAFRCSVLDEAEGCKLEYDSLKAADYYVDLHFPQYVFRYRYEANMPTINIT